MPRPPSPPSARPASKLIDQRVRELGDWRGATLQRMRDLIHEVVPEVVEEWKWRGVPVWSLAGGLCTGESYKASIKLTFHHGASLADPSKLFTSSLDGNLRRAIDLTKGAPVNAAAFKALVRAAVAYNLARIKPSKTKAAGPRKATVKVVSKKAPAKARPKKAGGRGPARPAKKAAKKLK